MLILFRESFFFVSVSVVQYLLVCYYYLLLLMMILKPFPEMSRHGITGSFIIDRVPSSLLVFLNEAPRGRRVADFVHNIQDNG